MKINKKKILIGSQAYIFSKTVYFANGHKFKNYS